MQRKWANRLATENWNSHQLLPFFMREVFREENVMKLSNRAKDITGHRFGRLLVMGPIKISERNREVVWECLCDCGKKLSVIGSVLRNGHTKSCGCLKSDVAKKNMAEVATTHGKRHTLEYKAWEGLKQRCQNKNNPGYHKYGGRGIGVCKEWDRFEAFYKDMGEKPTPDHSIERVDNNKGYSPDNCIWATKTEQVRNRRVPKSNKTGTSGVFFKRQAGKYQARIGVDGKRLSLGYFNDLTDAVKARVSAEKKYWGKAYQQ